ncbi:MAG: tetratricopeptide repeat protein [Proteobacteria bacterium]|nr:tetratricopeptide repeat protein [Pseudomonadota bacterium]
MIERIGRYRVGSLLGSGGAGRVYEAVLEAAGMERPVALKVLHKSVEGLRREARMGGLLRHRNLVDVYEIGEADGQWFCAMELCEHGALSGHLPLSPRSVVEVGRQVCAALSYAHGELGLVHLDLKPDNLLVSAQGVVKVADLGIARAQGFDLDGLHGTPAYMAPEQSWNLEVDARADLYALGVTLVELATGRRPETTTTLDLDSMTADPSATVNLAVEGAIVLPVPDVPDWLFPAVERCIQVDPDARWANMEALDAALAAIDAEGASLREILGIEDEVVVPDDGNLPAPQGALLGRERELAEAVQHLSKPGLVTLRGPAGIGKSSLSVEVARALKAKHGGEAWLCELAAVQTEAGLTRAVAANLGMRLPDDNAVEAVGRALAARGRLVLILDNFEQIVGLRDVIASWCAAAPEMRAVVTSRVPLELRSEVLVDLGPLPADVAAELMAARAALRGVHIETADVRALAMQLEGVPLALELAAGRLGVLSPADVEQRLGEGILRSGEGGRHGTLEGALELSWALLDEPLQRALIDLTVFVGGFDSEAAEAVAAGVDALDGLLRHSLLRSREGRLDMFVSVRAFASAKADRDAALRAHGAHFAGFGDEAHLASLRTHGGVQARRVLAADLDNLVAACRRAIERADGEVAAKTLRAIWGVLVGTGPFRGAADLAEEVLQLPLTPLQRAHASYVAAEALQRGGDLGAARVHAERSVACIAGFPDERLHVTAQFSLGLIEQYAGDVDASGERLRKAYAMYGARGDRGGQAVTASSLGSLAFMRGELPASVPFYERAGDLAREVGNRTLQAAVAGNLGIVYRNMGRLEEAMAQYEMAVRIRREVVDLAGEARALGSRAVARQETGDVEGARADYEQSLELARSTGDRHAEANAIGNLATLFEENGQRPLARTLYEQAIELYEAIGDLRHLGVMLGNLATLLIKVGESEQASVRLGRAVELSAQAGDRRLQGHWLVERSRLQPVDQAGTTLNQAKALLEGTGDRPMLGNLTAAYGDLAVRQGNLSEARLRLLEALELSTGAEDLARAATDELAKKIETAEQS